MSVLPIAWDNKVDSSELLAFLQQYGSIHYLSAAEINLVRDAINELFSLIGNSTTEINYQEITLTFIDSYGFSIAPNLNIRQVLIGKNYDCEPNEYTYSEPDGDFQLIGDATNLGLEIGDKIRIRTF